MDLGILGKITLDLNFLSALFSIVIIDLILAGDNAVVLFKKKFDKRCEILRGCAPQNDKRRAQNDKYSVCHPE